jgi:excisionase family DNA binding protein
MLHLVQMGASLGLKERIIMAASARSLIPTQRDVLVAKESRRLMKAGRLGRRSAGAVLVNGKSVAIPAGVMRLMESAIAHFAEGKAVAIVPLDEEISPQEAARLLNVSRPYAAKLFDEGAIPSRRVGTHRRALTGDVLAYKQREKEARLRALDQLAAEGQRLKLGY